MTMSDKIASSSTSTSAPTVKEVNGWDRDKVKGFLEEKKADLDFENKDIDKIYNQKVELALLCVVPILTNICLISSDLHAEEKVNGATKPSQAYDVYFVDPTNESRLLLEKIQLG